jgi:hypothetical protein
MAEAFNRDADTVMAPHSQGIAWGALCKLYAITRARRMAVEALLQEIGFMADGQPRNLCQLVTATDKPGMESPDTVAAAGHVFGHGHGRG